MNMDMETIIMELVVNGGNARSKALEAITAAGKGDFATAEAKMEECQESMIQAHHSQTELLQAEVNGEPTTVTLLMVHAQDHLMNAITVRDLAQQMIQMYRKLYE